MARSSTGRVAAALAVALALTPALARAADDAGALFATGDFDAAAKAYTTTLARDHKDADANLGLGTIELYRNHLTNAESLLRTALSNPATADRAQRELRVLAGRRGNAGQYEIHWQDPGNWANVPFVQTDPLPVVKVRVNNKRDAYFLIDTGAPDIALDTSFAQELGLKTQSAGVGVFAGGRHAPVLSAILPSLRLGGVQIGNVPAHVLPTRSFGGQYRIDGVIGTGLLMRFLSTLDYTHGYLRLVPSSTTVEVADASRTAIVPMWLVGDHFIFARGRINDAPEALFNIDTGLAGGGVQATKAEVDAAHITLDEAHAGSGMGGGGMVRFIPFKAVVSLGDASVTDVPGIYTPEGDQFGIFPFAVAGTISHSFFRRFSVTFDFVGMRLIIERP